MKIQICLVSALLLIINTNAAFAHPHPYNEERRHNPQDHPKPHNSHYNPNHPGPLLHKDNEHIEHHKHFDKMDFMMQKIIEAMLQKMAEPQMADYMATFKWNYYNALIKKGFSKEQALQIVISTEFPKMQK